MPAPQGANAAAAGAHSASATAAPAGSADPRCVPSVGKEQDEQSVAIFQQSWQVGMRAKRSSAGIPARSSALPRRLFHSAAASCAPPSRCSLLLLLSRPTRSCWKWTFLSTACYTRRLKSSCCPWRQRQQQQRQQRVAAAPARAGCDCSTWAAAMHCRWGRRMARRISHFHS